MWCQNKHFSTNKQTNVDDTFKTDRQTDAWPSSSPSSPQTHTHTFCTKKTQPWCTVSHRKTTARRPCLVSRSSEEKWQHHHILRHFFISLIATMKSTPSPSPSLFIIFILITTTTIKKRPTDRQTETITATELSIDWQWGGVVRRGGQTEMKATKRTKKKRTLQKWTEKWKTLAKHSLTHSSSHTTTTPQYLMIQKVINNKKSVQGQPPPQQWQKNSDRKKEINSPSLFHRFAQCHAAVVVIQKGCHWQWKKNFV